MTCKQFLVRASVASLGLALAACASPVNGPEAAFDPMVRFPINVEPRMASLRIPYEGQAAGFDSNTSAQLARFAKDYLDRGAGAIAVSAASQFPQASAEVAERLVGFGIPRDKILLANEPVPDAGNDVTISYIRYEANAPTCGDWSKNLGNTAANTTSPNFGCATQHNLAIMVADPRDLVAPGDLGPDDVQRRLTVLDKYRKGETTVAEKTAAQSGVVSAVASGGM